jgi:integrase
MASNQSKRRRHRRSFGAIRQLASGNYQASFKSLDGSNLVAPQTFKTREAADQYLAIMQADQIAEKQAMEAGRWILNKNRGAIPLGDYIARHFATKQDWAERTRELNERLAKRWILSPVAGHCLADKNLDSITPLMVREWFAAVQRASFESATLNKTPKPLNESAAAKHWATTKKLDCNPLGRASAELLAQWRAAGSPQPIKQQASNELSPAGRTAAAQTYRLLKSIFNAAIADELLDRSPIKDKTATIVRSRKAQAATSEQVAALAEQVPARYRAAVLVAAYGCFRQGEQFALARKHYNTFNRTLTIERAVKKLQGKPAFIGTTKTIGSNRTIVLPKIAAEALELHLEHYVGSDPESLIFTNGQGSLVTSAELCGWFIPARERAGLPTLRWHDLRSTGLTIAASTGASISALMNRAGHTSVRAAMIYQSLTKADDQKIADSIDSQLDTAKLYELAHFREATA